jgi:hypothetical protein
MMEFLIREALQGMIHSGIDQIADSTGKDQMDVAEDLNKLFRGVIEDLEDKLPGMGYTVAGSDEDHLSGVAAAMLNVLMIGGVVNILEALMEEQSGSSQVDALLNSLFDDEEKEN